MRRGPLGSRVEENDRENCKQELSRAAATARLQSLARALLSSKGQKVFYSASSPLEQLRGFPKGSSFPLIQSRCRWCSEALGVTGAFQMRGNHK